MKSTVCGFPTALYIKMWTIWVTCVRTITCVPQLFHSLVTGWHGNRCMFEEIRPFYNQWFYSFSTDEPYPQPSKLLYWRNMANGMKYQLVYSLEMVCTYGKSRTYRCRFMAPNGVNSYIFVPSSKHLKDHGHSKWDQQLSLFRHKSGASIQSRIVKGAKITAAKTGQTLKMVIENRMCYYVIQGQNCSSAIKLNTTETFSVLYAGGLSSYEVMSVQYINVTYLLFAKNYILTPQYLQRVAKPKQSLCFIWSYLRM